MATKKFPSLGDNVTSHRDMKQSKSNQYDPNGIFSEQIFGPVKDYCCQCGKLNVPARHAGKVCSKCGVLCTTSDIRRTTFAQIELPLYYVKPAKIEELSKLLKGFDKNLLNIRKAKLYNVDCKYIGISKNHTELKLFSKNIDSNNRTKYKILPFKITGLYTLYLGLSFLDRIYNVTQVQEIFENNYISNIVYVLPPGVRPHNKVKNSNKLHTSMVNKLYTQLLTKKNKLEQTLSINNADDEEEQFTKIVELINSNNITPEDNEVINLELDSHASILQDHINNIYEFALDQIKGKQGIIRKSILSRTIDFSARTVVRCDPSLPPWQIKVSKSILKKLWSDKFMYYLYHVKGVDYDMVFNKYILNGKSEEYVAENEIFDEFLNWYYS